MQRMCESARSSAQDRRQHLMAERVTIALASCGGRMDTADAALHDAPATSHVRDRLRVRCSEEIESRAAIRTLSTSRADDSGQ